MKRNTMIKILKALSHDSGAGDKLFFLLSHVVFLSGVPRMTAYRYLKRGVELGFVEPMFDCWREGEISRYAITKAGRDFAGIIR